MSIFICRASVSDAALAFHRNALQSFEWFHRLRLRDLRAAFLAGTTRVVVPEIEHGLAEMLDDVGAIKIDVFDQRPAVLTVKDHMFMFSRRTTPLDHDADGVRRTDRRMRNIRWNKEGFAFAHEMIDDAVAFPDAHFDVAFELVEILLRVDEMKIVPGIRALDHHHKKIAPVVKITVADRRFKSFPVLFDPLF